jgi:hypothetical protein
MSHDCVSARAITHRRNETVIHLSNGIPDCDPSTTLRTAVRNLFRFSIPPVPVFPLQLPFVLQTGISPDTSNPNGVDNKVTPSARTDWSEAATHQE